MKKYFKFIGIIELIVSIFGVVIYLIYSLLHRNVFYVNESIFTTILTIVILILIAPAIGLLFIAVSDLIEYKDAQVSFENIKNNARFQNQKAMTPKASDSNNIDASSKKDSAEKMDDKSSGTIDIKEETNIVKASNKTSNFKLNGIVYTLVEKEDIKGKGILPAKSRCIIISIKDGAFDLLCNFNGIMYTVRCLESEVESCY